MAGVWSQVELRLVFNTGALVFDRDFDRGSLEDFCR